MPHRDTSDMSTAYSLFLFLQNGHLTWVGRRADQDVGLFFGNTVPCFGCWNPSNHSKDGGVSTGFLPRSPVEI